MAGIKGSKFRRVGYGIGAATALLIVAVFLAFAGGPVPLAHAYYIPSEAMMPTLLKNDRLMAIMLPPKPLRRGDTILFRVGDSTYIKRIAGLPGDRIAFAGGRVILNGQSVAQQPVGTETVNEFSSQQRVTRLREHFPGEEGDHFIYDSGPSPEDDMPEQRVALGHLFVLGDNRDNSADSRIPRSEQGVEQLPIGDITGRPGFYTWGPSHKFGQAIH
ncbi:MAG TPA: signal peptidase I [Allosphingosinicella sp.]|jgi:signal peptidase I|nr:signal peptidase I [Allosphingosinicella sp.]